MSRDTDLTAAGLSSLRQATVPGLSDYPTPAQAAVYLGEYYVDDIYSIEWELSDSTTPVHTYFDRDWVTAIAGKRIVSGNLAINFRYPGYLAYAISAKLSSALRGAGEEIKTARSQGNAYLRDYLEVMTSGTEEDRIKALRDAAIQGRDALRRVSALGLLTVSDIKSKPSTRIAYDDAFEAQNPLNNRIIPVDIEIHYGDLDTTHTMDMIKDVVFVGKAKQIQAGAAGSNGTSVSGMNLLEVYSFFAKTVVQSIVPGNPY